MNSFHGRIKGKLLRKYGWAPEIGSAQIGTWKKLSKLQNNFKNKNQYVQSK